ncbi:MAG: cellulase family glycosylhydrolase [Verrucomicrobia bacterium]|nr:cellulase family glycosylhydrolase [Verrucomicrobiota bacterium]
MKQTVFALSLLAFGPIAGTQGAPPAPMSDDRASGSFRDGARFELRPGEYYFRELGRPAFVLGRNPAGMNPNEYEDHLRHAAAAGERFMRIHLTFTPPNEKAGEIDAGMLQSWDAILDAAEKHGLAVLPVLGVWADWNDGSNNETWHAWDRNPFNVARGGPAKQPGDLFGDTLCRRLWLKRVETLVRRWAHRRAIVGWEIFSELDLVTGATEARAVEFTERAAAAIRAADPWKRPLTASQAGIGEWPKLLQSTALDFTEIHPYSDGAFGGRLDDLILAAVRARLAKYGKPVLIGESGLSSRPPRGTLEVAARAEVGIRHAIWAAGVSGAMNGRALWWQDGYDQFEKADLVRHYHEAAATAAAFVRGVDFTGFMPVPCVLSDGVKGAVIGNDRERLGWFRDIRCDPPDWPAKPVSGQAVSVEAPGDSWHIAFFDPVTGRSGAEHPVAVRDLRIRMVLPEFQESVAVRMKHREP